MMILRGTVLDDCIKSKKKKVSRGTIEVKSVEDGADESVCEFGSQKCSSESGTVLDSCIHGRSFSSRKAKKAYERGQSMIPLF